MSKPQASQFAHLSAAEVLERFAPRGEAAEGVEVDQDFDAETTTIRFPDGSALRVIGPTVQVIPPAGDYFPSYQIPEDTELDAATAAWLTEQSGEGPLRLIDVTDVCATYKVRAELRDEHGFSRGWVQPDGSYRLG